MNMPAESEEPVARKPSKCRILIVDDHPLMREGLSMLIQSQRNLEICGKAGDAAEALRLVEASVPDVAVIDIFLPGPIDGIQLTRTILASHPEVKVLILSMLDDVIYVQRALKAGASGYVTKAEVSSVILDAIRTVWSGGTSSSIDVPEQPPQPEVRRRRGRPKRHVWGISALTNRELELLELFGRGFSRTEVAERMHISVKTVEAHRAHIRTKLWLKSANELGRYAMRWVERAEGGSLAP